MHNSDNCTIFQHQHVASSFVKCTYLFTEQKRNHNKTNVHDQILENGNNRQEDEIKYIKYETSNIAKN